MYFRRIYELREDHDITIKAMAAMLNLNPQVYRRYEKGDRDLPLYALIQLADYYGTSTDYLLGRTDDPSRPAPKKRRA